MFHVKQVSLQLGGQHVLRDISCELPSGLTMLVGCNGAGKTTLLKLLAGLIAPSAGEMLWKQQDWCAMTPANRARHMAYVPQQASFAWPMPVRDVVGLGGAATDALLACFGLQELAHTPIDRLSGGQRQRVHLARAVASDPQIVLLDEPVAAQDPYWQHRLLSWLREWAGKERHVLAVTHDVTLASRYAEHALVLKEGRVAYAGVWAMETLAPLLSQLFNVQVTIVENQAETCMIAG